MKKLLLAGLVAGLMIGNSFAWNMPGMWQNNDLTNTRPNTQGISRFVDNNNNNNGNINSVLDTKIAATCASIPLYVHSYGFYSWEMTDYMNCVNSLIKNKIYTKFIFADTPVTIYVDGDSVCVNDDDIFYGSGCF